MHFYNRDLKNIILPSHKKSISTYQEYQKNKKNYSAQKDCAHASASLYC